MIGVAREVAALTGQASCAAAACRASRRRADRRPGAASSIEDPEPVRRATPRPCSKGVSIGPAPGWMQRRLTYAGMRPISNIVDITNYVMLEWGQPLHAFDYDMLVQRAGGKAPTITVRAARPGEILTTLDGVTRELTPETLSSPTRPGRLPWPASWAAPTPRCRPRRRTILLESANFDFVSIRRTMRAFNLPSEASVRFSKGIHPETVRPAAERAAELMRAARGRARSAGGSSIATPPHCRRQVITLRHGARCAGYWAWISRWRKRCASCAPWNSRSRRPDRTLCACTTPPHRLDIQAGSADLIEELVRIHGYDRLPATLLADQLPDQHTNQALVLEEKTARSPGRSWSARSHHLFADRARA